MSSTRAGLAKPEPQRERNGEGPKLQRSTQKIIGNPAAALALLAFGLHAPVIAESETINGWPVQRSEVIERQLDALDRAIREETYKQINGVVIVRRGKLQYERYYNGSGRDDTHDPRSVGKSFLTPVLGLAIADGHIDSLDQRIGDFYELASYPNYSPKKDLVTLGHLVTMSSGFEGFDFVPESVGNEENMYPQANWVDWTLSLPMSATRDPGDEWRYFTAGVVVAGDILNQVLPGGLEAYAHERLFEPLGITNYEWQHTPQRVANTGGGIRLTPLDFAKFGELHRTGGIWRGKRVLSARWVRESLEPSIETTVDGERYGRLWWHKTYTVNDSGWDTSFCSGNGGTKIFVFPDHELVVVITASAYNRRYAHRQVDDMMVSHVLPAVVADAE